MSTEEKKALMTVLTQLSPEDLNKALLIVAQNNPNFQATGQEVDLDIDAQVFSMRRVFSSFHIQEFNSASTWNKKLQLLSY